jgi:hypothetical protein
MAADRQSMIARFAQLGWVLGPLSLVCVIACGGSPGDTSTAQSSAPPSAAAGTAVDPCALVTSAEAAQALGAAVGDAERPKESNIPPRLATCRYVAQRGQGVAVMTVMVRLSDSASEARSGFRSAREQFPNAEAVAGLGDEAFWIANQLNVLRGTVYVNITGDFDRATAQAVAETALKRLQS